MGDPHITTAVQQQASELNRLGWYHSIELPDGRILEGFQSVSLLRSRLARFPIPEDLRGKTVLDIGAWDGWFSFEMERRGAAVVALDSHRRERFLKAKELMGSKVSYEIGDICRVNSSQLGAFDIVLFLGVLYHVKHPVLALENVCSMTKEVACIESYVTGADLGAAPVLEFYEGSELRGQFDNWCGPNVSCLMAMSRAAGFARVEFAGVAGERAHCVGYRRWPAVENAEGGAAQVTCVENTVMRNHSFSALRDDYVTLWFETQEVRQLGIDDVFPEIGGYACRPVHVGSTGGDGWQVVVKLPPGIAPGWHMARLRVGTGRFSREVRIGVDVPAEERGRHVETDFGVKIRLVTDGKTWERYRVTVGEGACISLWVEGIAEGTSKEDVVVRLNGADLPAVFLSGLDEEGLRQVNALLPGGLEKGPAEVCLVIGGVQSEAVAITVT